MGTGFRTTLFETVGSRQVLAMRRLLLLACCAFMAAPLLAANEWTHASSDHFDIYTTSGNRRAREALTYFERVHAYFFSQPNLSPRLTRPIRLVVFSNPREFRPYRPFESAIAYYRSSVDRDYIVMQSFGPDDYPVVVHEFVHMILARGRVRYPVWLSEGLAEYYSTVSLLGTLVTVGRSPENRLQDLSVTALLPLDRLFAVTRAADEYRTVEHAGPYYAESWALTHMLLTDPRYRGRSDRFFEVARGGTSTAETFRAVYAKTVKEVERDLNNYVRDGRFVERTARYRPPPRRAEAPVRAMSAFEADLVLANLLAAGTEDRMKARAAFDALARQRPDDLPLIESRALFEMRAGRAPEARGYFARAVELGSTDAQTYREYARLVGASDTALVEQLLQTAVSLQPGDVQTRVMLAGLLATHEPASVLAVLEPVTGSNPPLAFNVFQLRTNAHVALNQLEQARDAAREVVRIAAGRQQQALAANLLAQVEKSLAAQTSAAR